MALALNKNTQQTPLGIGKTATQVVKFIPAPRVYIKTKEGTINSDGSGAAPVQAYNTKSNGTTPAGWTDLGIVLGNATITYNKDIAEVTTGIDQVLRQSYVQKKTAQLEFTLSQIDDIVLEAVMGVTASQLINGSVYNFQVGTEDIVEKAMLLVVQNKLDSKEWQFYNPAAQMSFSFVEEDNAFALRVTAKMPAFKAMGKVAADPEAFISSMLFA